MLVSLIGCSGRFWAPERRGAGRGIALTRSSWRYKSVTSCFIFSRWVSTPSRWHPEGRITFHRPWKAGPRFGCRRWPPGGCSSELAGRCQVIVRRLPLWRVPTSALGFDPPSTNEHSTIRAPLMMPLGAIAFCV